MVVHDRQRLVEALALCRAEGWSWTVFGQGTRLIVRDGGLAGAVIRLGHGFAALEEDGEGLWAGAALPLAVVGLVLGAGAEALLRAPGSLGASLMLDAGWDPWVDAIRYISRNKERVSDLATMREKTGQTLVVEVKLRRGVGAPLPGPESPHSWYLPLDRACVGSTIAEAALGGTRLRQVCIPEEVPEMMVNLGGGTAKDLSLLQQSTIERVQRLRGEQLTNRMQWLGRP